MAHVLWAGHERAVPVQLEEGGVLAGMSLMQGHRLCVDVVDGGRVFIEPLP